MSLRKLLLADDSLTIQKVVNLTFAEEGIEVITADSGDAAIEKFNQNVPDLVMADVNLPGLDGYRFCELIKQNESTSKIPVILLVGTFEPFDQERAQRSGADDFMTKPFQSIRQLVNTVTNLLSSEEKTTDSAESAQDTTELELPTQTEENEWSEAEQTEEYQSEPETEEQEPENIEPPAPSFFDLDEFNLLEIPPIEFDFAEEKPVASEAAVADSPAASDKSVEMAATQTTENKSSARLTLEDISPDVIEAIADRVVEKLSERFNE